MIEIDTLRKSYRKSRGLDGFSLHLESNELVGLVGPNGAGKTTLIKILATLLPADSGSVRVSGHDVSVDPMAVRASLGYLPDVAGIYQDMRIGEFLEFFADAFRLKEPQRTAAIERALERAGLADRRNDFVEHLPLGWKQRLLLSKVLLHEPKLSFLRGGSDPRAYVHQASILGIPAIGIADHNTLAGVVRAYKELDNDKVLHKPKLLIGTRIVFIAEGKNVQEAQTAALAAGARAPAIRCELEFEGPRDAVDRAITGFAGARILERKEGFLLIELPGSSQDASAFLRTVLAAGITILHFDARGPGLEERYRRAFGEHTP